MMETVERVENQSWLQRNVHVVLAVAALAFQSFISEWVSLQVYFSALVLIYANYLFFSSENRDLNNWLRTNLFAFAVIAGLLAVIFILSRTMTFLAALVPENVAATFPFILAAGVILYLIGLGFYFVEKTTKN